MAGILFEDIFDVKDIDPDGKKFERGALEVCVCVCSKVNRTMQSLGCSVRVRVSRWT